MSFEEEDEELNCTLWVGNLDSKITEVILYELFMQVSFSDSRFGIGILNSGNESWKCAGNKLLSSQLNSIEVIKSNILLSVFALASCSTGRSY